MYFILYLLKAFTVLTLLCVCGIAKYTKFTCPSIHIPQHHLLPALGICKNKEVCQVPVLFGSP